MNKKCCMECFRSAISYQPPEVFMRFMALYPEQLTEKPKECSFHDNENVSGWDSQVLEWMFDYLDSEVSQ